MTEAKKEDIDKDLKRRNLMVTATSFNLYFIGGGYIPENKELSLTALSINFENTGFLILISWLFLAWFYWRYLIEHKGKYWSALQNEVKAKTHNRVLIYFLNRRTKDVDGVTLKCPGDYENGLGFKVKQITTNPWSVYIAYKGPLIENQGNKDRRREESMHFKFISNFDKYGLIRFWLIFNAAIKDKAFGDWFVPHALFWIACILGGFEWLSHIQEGTSIYPSGHTFYP